MKICSNCGKSFPANLEYFHKESSVKSGLRSDCKTCNRKRVREKHIPKWVKVPKGFCPLPSFNDYSINEKGQIWSSKFGRIMKPHKHKKHKYLQIKIKGRCKKIHQLLLEVFVGPCPEGMQCRHLDGNPENNELKNLKWGTAKENAQDRVNHGKAAKKLTYLEVKEIKFLLKQGIKQKDISKQFNVDPSLISDINTRKVWTHVD